MSSAPTIFITGASSGIGRTTATHFHSRGWNVVATMRNPKDAMDLRDLDRVLVTRLDVCDPESIKTAVQEGIEYFGTIEVLLNNAGYGAYGVLEAAPEASIRRQFDVNVIGLILVTQAMLPHFRANQNGTVINISSIGGQFASPLRSLYHSSKFAVEGFSEALSFELEAIGCRVKIIEPGMIRTDFLKRSLDLFNDESMAEYQDLVGKMFPTFRGPTEDASEPAGVAEVIFQAATDGTNRLRYPAGANAETLLQRRQELGDAQFIAELKARLGI